jgi:uncharacterized NAD(P)/FAD-binding protein YdhS
LLSIPKTSCIIMIDSPVVKKLAVIGAGPAALYLLKTLLTGRENHFTVAIFEARSTAGNGFPYGRDGAAKEHITNVSGNEIPELVTSTRQWLHTLPVATLGEYGINPVTFSEYQVFPRLLFGQYLKAQFDLLLARAAERGIVVKLQLNTRVTAVEELPGRQGIQVTAGDGPPCCFDNVIVCTGHLWPTPHEGRFKGYFDSPYPPSKIAGPFNHPVAIKGSSLTAIDAIRTLASHHGVFSRDATARLLFTAHAGCSDFSIVMYSLKGLLPGIRFHLEDSHLSADDLLRQDAIDANREANGGFLSLDFVFDSDFKEPMRKSDPDFYDHIKDMNLETFVAEMMEIRERADPFALLRAELKEAELSIRRRQSVHWKEKLSILSFAMNYPAKHFSAEDRIRLQEVLMPLISLIIAFIPQDSCEELLALRDAGRLSLVPVERDSHATPKPGGGITYAYRDAGGAGCTAAYETFIDCTGQPHLSIDDFPFRALVESGTVSQATLRFRANAAAMTCMAKDAGNVIKTASGRYLLKVPGLAITDCFNAVGKDGGSNPRLYLLCVPFLGGYNPDYSGLDFCEAAAGRVVNDIFGQAD